AGRRVSPPPPPPPRASLSRGASQERCCTTPGRSRPAPWSWPPRAGSRPSTAARSRSRAARCASTATPWGRSSWPRPSGPPWTRPGCPWRRSREAAAGRGAGAAGRGRGAGDGPPAPRRPPRPRPARGGRARPRLPGPAARGRAGPGRGPRRAGRGSPPSGASRRRRGGRRAGRDPGPLRRRGPARGGPPDRAGGRGGGAAPHPPGVHRGLPRLQPRVPLPGRARPGPGGAPPRHPPDVDPGRLGRAGRRPDRHLPDRLPGRLAAHRPHRGDPVRPRPPSPGPAPPRLPPPLHGGGMIRVRKPGLLTTVQDLGRPGLAHLGVPTAGAADRRAFGLANRLVGSRAGAAGLEITVTGPELELEAGGWVALTGGRVAADLDGRTVPMDMAVRAEPGQVLRVGSVTSGLRAYLAVRGGIGVPPVLGSRSTDTLARVGPPRLEEGARLPVGDQAGGDPFRQVARTPPVDPWPVLRP